MNKKILLIDIDSTVPNLALMKISAHHKALGDDVGFNNQDSPDMVYASTVFKSNKLLANSLKFYYPDAEIIIGGSGYSLDSTLPDEIETACPDYELYKDIYPYEERDFSLGYTTRGCNRSCYFCIVPQKEGCFHIVQHPKQFYDPKYDKIVFLDNNILLDRDWFFEVTDFCIKHNLKVWFTQGLDIRLLDELNAKRLSELKTFKGFHFAFDNSNMADLIKERCELLKSVGISIRSNVQFYVYCDSDQAYDDAVWRCRYLKELNTNPFVQYNIDKKPTKRINQLRRWANRKQAFWRFDIADYNRKKG
jgi:hypothetical protein